jgi:hypothetical protein
MEKAQQIKLLKELMQHLDADTNVDAGGMRRNPSDVYTCTDLARNEWASFFQRHPHRAGASPPGPSRCTPCSPTCS